MTTADYPIALPPRHALHEYRIQRVLGHGGFGITYAATDTTLRKMVAIKEYLPAQFAVRAEGSTVMPRTRRLAEEYRWGLERFLDEARTLARFRHANIVPVLRFFEAHGTAYIVMEYEEGRPLGEWLSGPGRLPPLRVRAWLEGLMDGLSQIHATGFLHRDIKPSNIIIRLDGTPVLVDFGAARQALLRSGVTLTSIVTPRYAPLEQYQSEGEQGPYTDIYALAAVAYHVIVGEPPPEAIARIRKDACRKLAGSGIAGYGAPFLSAIDRGLAVYAEDRPQTVADWRESMGTPAVEAKVGDSLAEATPAAAQTRVMQAPLTRVAVTASPGDARAPAGSMRLGGAGDTGRVRAAAPARRGGYGSMVAVAVVAIALGTAVYAWQDRGQTGDVSRTAGTPSSPPPSSASPAPTPGASKPASPSSPRTADTPAHPPASPPKPAGDPVPIKPSATPEPPGAKVGSIDDLLGKDTPPAASAPHKAARDKAFEATRPVAAQAQAAAELANRARQRAAERAGNARIRAAEAGKPDLPGAERVTFDDGSIYVGQLADGRRRGLGVAELRTGERQAGDWKDDRLDGLGTLRAGDGRGYEGEWKDGLPDGAGMFRLGPHERYYGEVRGGQPQGAGVRVLGDGRDAAARAGTWKNGALDGPGVETAASGERYEGAFRGGKREGPGIIVAPDGTRFHGTFVDGVADGYGVTVAPDGRMSSGEWRAGKLARSDD